MAQQTINIGASPNDGQGDPIRTAFTKCNDNFTELYSGIGTNAISNGNTSVSIPTSDGNILFNVDGVSNLVSFTLNGIQTTGSFSALGNITCANVFLNGNVNTNGFINAGALSAVGAATSGGFFTANGISAGGTVVANLITSTSGEFGISGNVTTLSLANNAATTAWVTGNASNVFIGNVNSVTRVQGNLTAGGYISTTGNITATNFVGAGVGTFRLPSLTSAQIANLSATNGDLIYNSTINKIQGFENGSWGNLI